MTVEKNLNRWFKEKWVDVSRKKKDGTHPPCGRSKAKTSSKGYPKCRPSVKVSSKTPKTSGSMTEGQKRAATKRKRSKKQGVGGKPTIVKAMDDAWLMLKARGEGRRREEMRRFANTIPDEGDVPNPRERSERMARIARHSDELAQHIGKITGKPPSRYKGKVAVQAVEGQMPQRPTFEPGNQSKVSFTREPRPGIQGKRHSFFEGLRDARDPEYKPPNQGQEERPVEDTFTDDDRRRLFEIFS